MVDKVAKELARHTLTVEELEEAVIDWLRKHGHLGQTEEVMELRKAPLGEEGTLVTAWRWE